MDRSWIDFFFLFCYTFAPKGRPKDPPTDIIDFEAACVASVVSKNF